jgi:preprotein translocase SecE subunit
MEIFTYKSDQGIWARRVVLGGAFFGGVFGAVSLFGYLRYSVAEIETVLWLFPGEYLKRNLWEAGLAGVPLTAALLLSVGLFLYAMYVVWEFMNRHERSVNFLVDTEKEMRKVSWSTKGELRGSSIVVVLAVFFLGVYLFCVDRVLSGVFQWMIGLRVE